MGWPEVSIMRTDYELLRHEADELRVEADVLRSKMLAKENAAGAAHRKAELAYAKWADEHRKMLEKEDG